MVVDRLWLWLRAPESLALFLALLAASLGLAQVIPQMPAGLDGPDGRQQWLATLSPAGRSLAEQMQPLALHRIFLSPWFWLPAAGLILSALVAAADYLPLARARLNPNPERTPGPPFLARSLERTGRIHRQPQEYLADLQAEMAAAGYRCRPEPDPATEARWVVAARHRWSWLAPLSIYGGLILLLAGLALSVWRGPGESVALRPGAAANTRLAGQPILLRELAIRQDGAGTVVGGEARLAFSPGEAAPGVDWPLFRPFLWRNRLVWLYGVQPLLRVSVRDDAGRPLVLFPAQPEIEPSTDLELELPRGSRSALFSGPQSRWAMRVTYFGPQAGPGEQFQVELLRYGETEPEPPVPVEADGAFRIGELSGQVDLDHSLRAFATPGWDQLLMLLGGALLLGGVAVLLWRPPALLIVSLYVRGSGGQATIYAETLGSPGRLQAELAAFLTEEGDA